MIPANAHVRVVCPQRRGGTRGFSLVELSIVLVILGLLVGGILAGKSLIRASELRTIITQQQSIVTAARSFRDKYFALPGDMPNATDFWGWATLVYMNCHLAASTTTATCNGNADGFIGAYTVTAASTSTTENARFWQHLANAGMLEGSYNGTSNQPPGRISTTRWYVSSLTAGTSPFPNHAFNSEYGNYLVLNNLAGLVPSAPVPLRNEELWNIDSKIDDGKPGGGKVMVMSSLFLTSCATVSSVVAGPSEGATAEYLMDGTFDNQCMPIFIRQW